MKCYSMPRVLVRYRHAAALLVVGCLALFSVALGDDIEENVKLGVPVTIPLLRNVDHSKRANALKSLQMRQKFYSMLLETKAYEREIPLDEEILSEKHLATYYGTISIKGTNFRVLFDTGSCEFWVPSMVCNTERCNRHARLPTGGDRLATSVPMNIQYLSGKVQGDMMFEDVVLGDITVKNQVVGVAKVVDIELLDDVRWDGILGLAYPNPTLTQQGVTPIFDTILKSRVLTNRHLSNQFAYFIDDKHGAVTFGGANCDLISRGKDKRSCIEQFKFVPITEKTYWTVTLHDVQVQYPGEQPRGGYCGPNGCKAIVDTGTYLIYGPQAQVTSMFRRELKSCGDHPQMPTFHFVFWTSNGQYVTLSLKPIDYILKFELHGTKECVVGISPDKDTIWTLGQVFLRSFYTVFDRDEDRIGFARIPRDNFRAINSRKNQASLIETEEDSDWDRISEF